MQPDVKFPLVLCKPTSQIIQPKFNQCKRFVLHPHFPFIYLTISILGSSTIFGLSLKYTLRFVPSICKEDQEKYDDAIKVMRDHIAAYKGAIIEAKIEVAKNMLMENEPIDKIARYTGLAKEDILKLN